MKKLSINDLQQYAESNGGNCLSLEYEGVHAKYLWKCQHGHRWLARAAEVVNQNQWCPICAGKRHRRSIYEMQDIAKSRGGECLSTTYRNTQTKLKWRCAHGHEWDSIPQTVIAGSWCPVCSSGLGERLTRTAFEQLFGAPFDKARPNWLVTKEGIQLELDGYNEILGIAFEHQGDQHHKDDAFFSMKMPFEKRIEYDETKRRLCSNNGITLIEIPQVGTKVKVQDLKGFIIDALLSAEKDGYNRECQVNYKFAYSSDASVAMLERLKGLAKKHGGQCLSEQYKGSKAPHLFICANCHIWSTPAESIVRGRWCPYCAAENKAAAARVTMSTLQKAAKKRGGRLLAKSYTSGYEKLEWECAKGHRWKASWNNIRCGKWCPECRKISVEELRKLAESRGGRLLSTEVPGSSTPVEWECAKGHRWVSRPNNVKKGTWCPYCAKNRKLTIGDMQSIAVERGGKCLSAEYINARTKLRWRCSHGHEWKAVPASIKSGTWCPVCANHHF